MDITWLYSQLQLFSYHTNCVVWDLQWYCQVHDIFPWLITTESLIAGQYYFSNHPYHPIAVFEECGHYGKYDLTPWHEPNMVHVRLLFLQSGLCDVHSCSLLFAGALDELQYFIWSLEWIEWGKFRFKAPRILIFGPTILSCIKRGRMCYKSIWSYGDLEIFIGYVFIELIVGWRQWILLWGTCQCLPTTYNSPVPNKINESLCLRNYA